jgi:hypothetical protein
MTPRPIPRAVQVPWEDLLTRRTLLHEHLRSFQGADDFVAKANSPRLDDRRDVAALERFAEEVFNVYVDLGRELLIAMRPDERAVVSNLSAEDVLVHLRNAKVISTAVFEEMDAIRWTRNSWQHGASFVPAPAVWRGAKETEGAIDRALAALQAGFARAGYALELAWPDLETGA